jgi:hypothetical protein
MSRKLAPLFLAMLVLAGAMGLKTIVAAHGDTTVMMAKNGSAPVPPLPFKNGSAPVPPLPFKNGSAPVPPLPFKNGSAPVPPLPFKSTSTSPWQ